MLVQALMLFLQKETFVQQKLSLVLTWDQDCHLSSCDAKTLQVCLVGVDDQLGDV
jgi:hypothetical protein